MMVTLASMVAGAVTNPFGYAYYCKAGDSSEAVMTAVGMLVMAMKQCRTLELIVRIMLMDNVLYRCLIWWSLGLWLLRVGCVVQFLKDSGKVSGLKALSFGSRFSVRRTCWSLDKNYSLHGGATPVVCCSVDQSAHEAVE
ncbi:hypothetical protein U9M48_002278 [Paspalum notatum var. saurae]|uniref:Uncharacterized protein n=1 Tax=Paspalum notatum var. saurae TaxID=547442 RepID=A0AAQ3PFU3_PASNO